MSKGYLLVILGLIGMVAWRQWQWLNWKDGIEGQDYIKTKMKISQTVEVREYDCILEYRGIRLSVAKSLCETSGIAQASAGDEIELEGRVSKKIGRVIVNSREVKIWSGYWWVRVLEGIRNRMLAVINQNLTEPAASLVSGVVLGQKSTMSESLKSALKRTGTTHVVTASGYNLTVIAGVINTCLLTICSRRKTSIIAIGLIWIYVIISGANPPVVRAGIMLSLMLVATYLGRETWVWWTVGISGLGMLGVWPWMISSLSFQLSMAATVGVIGSSQMSLGKHIQNPIYKTFIQTWWTALAASVMTAPLLFMAFGEVSWLGLVVNPLVLWLIPLITYLGLCCIGLGLIWDILAKLIAGLLIPLCWSWIKVVDLAAHLPVGMIVMEWNWWMTWGWWVGIVGIWRLMNQLEQRR